MTLQHDLLSFSEYSGKYGVKIGGLGYPHKFGCKNNSRIFPAWDFFWVILDITSIPKIPNMLLLQFFPMLAHFEAKCPGLYVKYVFSDF